MIKMHCDRCGEEIEGTSYYTIDINAMDINPKNGPTVTMSTAIQKLANAMSVVNGKPQYCKKCKDDIEKFIYNKE